MRRTVLSLTVLLAAMAIIVLPAGAREQATPGLTKGTITLGGTFPLSGPASSYAPIPAGMKAYFSYINSRRAKDGRRGVNGRQIVFKYLDDGYNPANTVQLTRQLVEQDHVFALVGGLGTEPTQAARTYANQMGVPQLFVSTGATEFGTKGNEYPWTIGWQPDYEAEGQVYGKYIVANMPNVKIGIIYQNDDYGKDYIRGLEAGLGAKKSLIVSKQGYEVTATSVASQVAAIKATGADTFVILATPGKTVQTYATAARLSY
jgi:branched-chain amino acid transport system substrate-binding protein